MASEKTGILVKHMLFSELADLDAYDGIWACASILHLPKVQLKDVFEKMICAIKAGGYLYSSFKYGEFEGIRGDRYFTDFTEDIFSKFVTAYPQLEMIEEWVSRDARPGRGEEKWLNVILRKSDLI